MVSAESKNIDLYFKGEIFDQQNKSGKEDLSYKLLHFNEETAKGIGQCHFSYFLANKTPSLVPKKFQVELRSLKNWCL